jgi:aspartate racemase
VKTAGMIGGIGPESTIAYYRAIVEQYRARTHEGTAPALIINSIDMPRMREMINENRLPEVTEYLAGEVERLERAGADFAVLAAVTPHIVFDRLLERVRLPLLSIVDATRDAALALGLRKLALLGTRYTMQAAFFPEAFAKAAVQIVTPTAEEQDYLHAIYFDQLVKGAFLPETRQKVLGIVERMQHDEGITAVILGGTELPLLLEQAEHGGVRFLDTMQIHVVRIVDELVR